MSLVPDEVRVGLKDINHINHITDKTKNNKLSIQKDEPKRISEIYIVNNLNPESIFIQVNPNHCKLNKKPKQSLTIIPSNESYSIPVYVDKKHHMMFITVYVQDNVTNKLICLCNSLQMNRKFIEIKRDKNGHYIIVPTHYMTGHSEISDVDSLFVSWPKYLANAMKNNGWNDSNLWSEISKQDLIDMGFKRGHQIRFFYEYNKIIAKDKTKENNNDNIIVKMLTKWNISLYLISSMLQNGWNNPEDWEKITDENFKQMNFKDGHIVKFKKHIKLKSHTMFKF
eukprot:446974_1